LLCLEDGILQTIFPGLASNHSPPDISLLNS
jgi:hypothetical protein